MQPDLPKKQTDMQIDRQDPYPPWRQITKQVDRHSRNTGRPRGSSPAHHAVRQTAALPTLQADRHQPYPPCRQTDNTPSHAAVWSRAEWQAAALYINGALYPAGLLNFHAGRIPYCLWFSLSPWHLKCFDLSRVDLACNKTSKISTDHHLIRSGKPK